MNSGARRELMLIILELDGQNRALKSKTIAQRNHAGGGRHGPTPNAQDGTDDVQYAHRTRSGEWGIGTSVSDRSVQFRRKRETDAIAIGRSRQKMGVDVGAVRRVSGIHGKFGTGLRNGRGALPEAEGGGDDEQNKQVLPKKSHDLGDDVFNVAIDQVVRDAHKNEHHERKPNIVSVKPDHQETDEKNQGAINHESFQVSENQP